MAAGLGAAETGGPLSSDERATLQAAREVEPAGSLSVEATRLAIRDGLDPLGRRLLEIRTAADRRSIGAFYTPETIVCPIVDWVLRRAPDRIVDAGCGSGRFATAAGRACPDVTIVAIDLDPVATLLTRAALGVVGAKQAVVIQGDYTSQRLPAISGRTAFLGNPPYVRHHDLTPAAKERALAMGSKLGYRVSGLSGLHTHFLLASMLNSRPGDVACFITSAEWLDVGYGDAVRRIFLQCFGGVSLHLMAPKLAVFDGIQTTAVIACGEIGAEHPAIRLNRIDQIETLDHLAGGQFVDHAVLASSDHWSILFRRDEVSLESSSMVSLGSLLRVHRGLVTGANDYFVLSRDRAQVLKLADWWRPVITDAREILDAEGVIRDDPSRKVLLDLPKDLDRAQFPAVDRYLKWGETRLGAKPSISERYITGHRRPWWYLGPQRPAPIVSSHMARRAPAFALNPDGLALVNIGHGLYPNEPLNDDSIGRLCRLLNERSPSFRGHGRTYQGGLEKFEPREMEALMIPASLIHA